MDEGKTRVRFSLASPQEQPSQEGRIQYKKRRTKFTNSLFFVAKYL